MVQFGGSIIPPGAFDRSDSCLLNRVVPDLPIVALSGYVGPEDVTDYDFDGFLRKPFQIEEFRSAVATAAAKAES